MNSKKIMFFFLLSTSSLMITSDSDPFKKSTLVVLGTYTVLSIFDSVLPMESFHSSQTFTCVGGLATLAALMVNNDTFTTITTAGLIGSNVYARSYAKESDLF